MRKLAPLAMVVVFGLTSVASANLLLNSSFETVGTDEWLAQDWWRNQDTGYSDMCDRNNWDPHTGSWDMLVKGYTPGKSAMFGQWVAQSFNVGDVLTFSIYGDCEADFTADDVLLGIEFHTASSVITNTVSIYSSFLLDPGTYGQYTAQFTNTLSDLTGVSAFVLVNNCTAESGSRSVYFDDASLTAVPEPTVMALFGFAGLIFLARRRIVRRK